MGPKTRAWVFLLLFGTIFKSFPQQFIITDAEGGVFSSDQKPSFALEGPGWLRLLLDNREIYRGRGPAYPELGINRGEERGFSLRAEYYSPEDELLESRSWHIYIDKKAPVLPNMEFRNTPEGLRLITEGGEPNAKIRALADIQGSLVFFPDLENAEPPPFDSFPALIWAEDPAGNCSEPRAEYFEISTVRIENPVPGDWLNAQTLIISGAEGKSVYWTADGTNPLEPGGTGRLYRGPERVERRGRITLRIAWRDSAGRLREDSTAYSVTGTNEAASDLSAFQTAEEKEISSLTILSVPSSRLWSMGGAPRLQGGESVSLRPEPLVKRTAALHLSAGQNGSGVFRFAYLLNGGGSGGSGRAAPAGALAPLRETFLHPAVPADVSPRLITSGRSRVIFWPEAAGAVRFSWNAAGSTASGPWQEGTPFPVPLPGGTLSWLIAGEGGEADVTGPYSVSLPPLSAEREPALGRVAYRNYPESENTAWKYVSEPLDHAMVNLSGAFDVCDGEDLEWAFVSLGGTILERQRRDRLAPPAPQLSAPPEGSWRRGPVTVSVISGEAGAEGFISARVRYASDTVEIVSGKSSLDVAATLGEIAEVTVEAQLVDASGNRSPKTTRRFTLDPKTVYVSSHPPAAGTSAPKGGMDNPFALLEEAMAYAAEQGRRDIRITGNFSLDKPVTVSRPMTINGEWRSGENPDAVLALGDDFCWNVKSGAGLVLSSLGMERKTGARPLFQVEKSGRVEIAGVTLANTGPLVSMGGGLLAVRNSRMTLNVPGEQRVAAVSGWESRIEVSGSRIQLEGTYGLLFDLEGGSFSAAGSVFLAGGGITTSLITLNGTRGSFNNVSLTAEARDYAAALEASASELILSGASVEVSAKDAGGLLLNRGTAMILDSLIRVEGSFSARAAEISGPFPLVQNSRFYSTGSAGRADVFSGAEAAVPARASITNNLFSGFTHIWGGAWPLDELQGFNRAFASPDRPNRESP